MIQVVSSKQKVRSFAFAPAALLATKRKPVGSSSAEAEQGGPYSSASLLFPYIDIAGHILPVPSGCDGRLKEARVGREKLDALSYRNAGLIVFSSGSTRCSSAMVTWQQYSMHSLSAIPPLYELREVTLEFSITTFLRMRPPCHPCLCAVLCQLALCLSNNSVDCVDVKGSGAEVVHRLDLAGHRCGRGTP